MRVELDVYLFSTLSTKSRRTRQNWDDFSGVQFKPTFCPLSDFNNRFEISVLAPSEGPSVILFTGHSHV